LQTFRPSQIRFDQQNYIFSQKKNHFLAKKVPHINLV
jgi:hypothetical protein